MYSVVKSGTRANDYLNSIDWLLESATNLICHAIKKAELPLDAYKVDNTFKLYLNDVGSLNELAGIPYKDIIFDGDNIYKGSVAENYVATCLASNGMKLYYYKDNRYEIDFIARINDELIPIEVKAADNTVSTSLKSYIEK